jgi:hypothetical protein
MSDFVVLAEFGLSRNLRNTQEMSMKCKFGSTVTRFLLVALLAAVVLVPALVNGQVGAGSLQGAIKDPSGALVQGAKVTIVNVDTQLTRNDESSSSGAYQFQALTPGLYKLSVDAKGFARYEQRVQVTVGSALEVNVTLSLGTTGTTIEVLAEGAATVNVLNQEVSSVVTSRELTQLPTLTRNPYDLVATASNAQQDSQAGVGDGRGAGYSLNGQRSASTSILLDGAENVDLFTASVGQQVPLDSMQEFRVVSNGMTAEYGRASGGVVNVATKSGTNDFHGSAYEFNRVSALASNTYNNAADGVAKARFARNQFGFSIGGPAIKNKLFFFNNTEWIRVRSQAPQITLVADPAFIAAASAATQQYFTTFGKLRTDLKQIGTVTGNDLDFTPGAKLAAYLGPTCASAGVCPGVVFDKYTYNTAGDAGGGNPQNTIMTVARVDLNISDRTQLFGRYSLFSENDFAGVINTSPYVGYETGQTNKDNAFMLSVTHTFGPNLVSNSRVTLTRLNGPVQPLGANPISPTLYTSNAVVGRNNGDLIAFPGYNEYTPGNSIPFGGPQNLFQVYHDMSFIHGSHTFRFGGQYIYTQDNRVFGAYEAAVQALSNSPSKSLAFDNFLNGYISRFQGAVFPQGKLPCPHDPVTGDAIVTAACTVTLPVGPPNFSRSNIYNDFAFYGQDSWKVTPRLTLNLGLRWEYYGVQHNRNTNLDSNFYLGSGSDIFDQIRNGTVQIAKNSPVGGLWAPQKKNFGPRLGFAYDVFGNGKTSLRGGAGIAYERNFGNVTFNVIQNPPNYGVLSLSAADAGLAHLPIYTDNAGPLGGSTGTKALGAVSLRYVSENIKTAYTEQWNLGLEHEIRPNVIASLTYNGGRGIHQYSISNLNESGFAQVYLGDTSPNTRLQTQFSNINNRGSSGDSYYHGLVGSVRGTFRDVQFNAGYTFSHSIDTLSSTFSDEVANNGLGYVDPFRPSIDKASSDYDARHRISLSAVVPLPIFKHSSSRVLKEALGGFSFAPIFTYHTGYPFTMFDCTWGNSPYNCPRAFITPGSVVPKSGKAGADTGGNLFDYLTVPAARTTTVVVNGFDANGNPDSAVNVIPGPNQYAGPAFITGTSTPFPIENDAVNTAGTDNIYDANGNPIRLSSYASNLPTCTGLLGKGCAFPSNMVGRNTFVGPGNWNLNFGIYKDFSLTERFKLQLRGEFFDLTNHKNFYVLGFGQGGADVGASPTVQAKKGGYGNPFDDHRNVQLALKLIF